MSKHGLMAFVLVAGIIASASPAYPAQVAKESFTGGANGWVGTTGSTPFGETGVWSFTGGAARVLFFNPGFAVPDSASLSNTPAATSGAFTGNYDQAGVNLIGFSFLAPQIVPSGFVILEWAGSTSMYQRGFTVTATGVWYHFSASLADEARHQWTTLQGSSDDFAAARQSVKFVTIRFSRNGLLEHQFVVDDLYLSGLPDAAGLRPAGGATFAARWDALQTSRLHMVESAPEVTGTWTAVQSFVATNVTQTISFTNDAPRQFWRMVRP